METSTSTLPATQIEKTTTLALLRADYKNALANKCGLEGKLSDAELDASHAQITVNRLRALLGDARYVLAIAEEKLTNYEHLPTQDYVPPGHKDSIEFVTDAEIEKDLEDSSPAKYDPLRAELDALKDVLKLTANKLAEVEHYQQLQDKAIASLCTTSDILTTHYSKIRPRSAADDRKYTPLHMDGGEWGETPEQFHCKPDAPPCDRLHCTCEPGKDE